MKIRLIDVRKDELFVVYTEDGDYIFDVTWNEEYDTVDIHIQEKILNRDVL